MSPRKPSFQSCEAAIKILNDILKCRNMPAFIAATVSPRRHKILEQLGVTFTVFQPTGPEIHYADDPVHTVSTNARAKHAECAEQFPEAWILSADTVVECDGRCIGKPADSDDARRMLIHFSGRTQQVFTAVAMSKPVHTPDLRIVAASVRFKTYEADCVDAYLAKANTLDRAGAYDIATHSEMLIASHTGSFSNIMGLPAETVSDWLRAHAYPFKRN